MRGEALSKGDPRLTADVEARRLMLMEEMNIADVSYRVGTKAPSQFSREYRRLFGTPLHRDVGRLRGVIPEAAA
jgi:transcriptional regulator GlxA family with amidase domain